MVFHKIFPTFKLNKGYIGIFIRIMSVPQNIVMDLNNVMTSIFSKIIPHAWIGGGGVQHFYKVHTYNHVVACQVYVPTRT